MDRSDEIIDKLEEGGCDRETARRPQQPGGTDFAVQAVDGDIFGAAYDEVLEMMRDELPASDE